MEEKNCLFCNFVKKEIPCEIIYEDDEYLAFLDINPMHPGHTLVIPKKHTDYIFDLNEEELSKLFITCKKVSTKLKKAINTEKVGIVVEGFLVRHAHVHLVPMNKGMALDPCLQKRATKKELENIFNKIKKHNN